MLIRRVTDECLDAADIGNDRVFFKVRLECPDRAHRSRNDQHIYRTDIGNPCLAAVYHTQFQRRIQGFLPAGSTNDLTGYPGNPKRTGQRTADQTNARYSHPK